MKHAGNFGASEADQGSIGSVDFDLSLHREDAAAVKVSDAHLLFSGNYERFGRDLIISDQTHHFVVPNYFHGDKRPLLVSPDGVPLDAAIVDALTGHTQYAQAGGGPAGKVVGHIAKMTGSASIVRNGVTIDVQVGDAVYQSDVLQTGSSSTVGLVLADGTAFNLSANARLMLNDLTFDASSTSNSSFITLVQGAASFVAGQVAKTGDMKVATPAAVIGVRGTAVKLEIDANDGKVDISVIDQQDGQVHAVDVFRCVPTGVRDPLTGAACSAGALITTVSSNGPSISLTPTALDVIVQQNNKTPAQIAQEFGTYQAAIDTYNVQKQIDPNLPQHTENTGGNNANTGQTRYASFGSTPAEPLATAPFVELTSLATQGGSSDTVPSTGLVATSGSNSINGTTSNITPNTATDGPVPLLQKTAAPTVTANLAIVTGPSSGGNITSNSELNGTGLPNTMVNFTIDGNPIASTVLADAQGRWSFQPIGLADGTHTIVASQTDTFGNTGTASLSFTLDTVAPSGGTPSLVAGSDTGSVNTDNITAATAPTFIVELNPSVVAGDTVELLLGGSPLAHPVTHVITASDVIAGSVGLTVVSGDLGADGPKQVTAQFRDTAGNSSMGLAQNFTLDTTAPIVAITSAGGLANQTQTITGTVDLADAGATVAIFNGANPIGSAIVQSDGTWSSSVTLNNGNNALTALVADAAGNLGVSNSVIYTIDNAPVATPVTLAAGTEDTAYIITAASLLAGVTDVDGQALSITSVGVASGGGNIVNNGNGTWTYTPAANSSGPVSFSYTASDGLLSASSTASLTLAAVNDAPVATPVTLAAGNEDTAYIITAASLLAGVTDVDGQALSITSVSVASGGGSIVNNGNGTWTYTPAANSSGPVSFSYTASDGSLSASSTASLTINPVNDAPVATPVTLAAGTEDTAYTITAATLLAGVTDVDGPSLSITAVSVASGGGSIVNNGNGTWTYTPAANSSGPVSFSYTASDGSLSAGSTASLTINPVNDAPVITAASLTVAEGGTVLITSASIGVTDPDSSSFAFTVSNVTHGAFQTTTDGLTWTNATTFTTTDLAASHVRFVHDGSVTAPTFSIQANDGAALNNLSNLFVGSVLFNNVNHAPVATPVTLAAGTEDTAYTISAATLLTGVTDVDGQALSITSVSVASGGGSIVNNGNGTWTYTPAANSSGPVSFSYTASDGSLSASSTASLTINPVNDAPVATPVTLAAGTEDTAYTITAATLLAGVTDVDGPSLSITAVSVASGGGSIVNNGNGTWTYTPAANSSGPVSFSYTASDGSLSAGSTASLTINPVNDAPVATPVTLAAGTEDTAYTITAATLLAGVTDVDGPSLSITAVSVASGGGSIVNNGNGTWTYTPAANSSGPVSFSYTASDGSLSASSTASLTINPVNDAPVATPVTLAAGTEDTAYTITAASLLAGVTDVDGPALSITSVSVASGGGNIVNNGNGTWTYTPAANSSGPVSFSYTASDGSLSASSTASLTINPVNDAPVITAASLTVAEGGTVLITSASIGVTDPDSSSFAFTVSNVTHGAFQTTTDGLTWTNATTFTTTDLAASHVRFVHDGSVTAPTFSIQANDGAALNNLSNLFVGSVLFNNVNHAPVATPVTLAAGTEDTAYTISAATLLTGVTDVDGQALSITSVSVASGGGSIVNNGNGTWTYTPAANSSGPVSFSYTASDGSLSAGSTASLTINPVNDAPVATPVTLAAGTEDTAYTITAATLLAGVTDVDGPALSITSVSVASGGGSIVNNGNGTWTYTPAANSSGPVSFSYTASDGSLSASSTASLTINPVNDAPVITAASLTVAEGGTVLITSASIGVTDPDSSSFAFTVSNVTHGAFQTTTDGVTWTNATTFTTTDLAASHVRFVHDGSVTAPTFSIQANDGAALNNLSNVFVGSVLFNNVNHAPVATPVTLAAGTEDTAYTITAATLLTGVTDVDGQALSITSVSVASGGGSIVNNGNGTWTYTPAANSSGPVSFSYTASDGSLSAGSTASLTINPVNDAPVATPVTLAAGTEDTAYIITAASLLAGVTDVDGPSLSITAVSVASGGGSIVNNGNGTWTYTPAANSSGPVSFSYTASDGSLSASSTASLTINPVNDAPVATPVTLAAGTEDTAYTITAASLLAGVTDVDGPALSITSVSVASGGGSIVNNGNGTWTYTPAANSSGPVSFSYTASDGSLSASSTASLTINPVNDAPVATPVTLAAGTEDTAYTITAASLLAGVTDVDGPALSITSVSVASGGGNIVNNGNGTWTYTPAANSSGPVSFSYTASDGSLSASSTASLTINPVNDAPVATPVTLAAGTEDTAYIITAASLLAGVTDVDGQALSITSVGVASGGGNIVNNGNGTWTYTPAANSSGPVSFSYTASDGSLSASSTASLTINPVNDAPVATPVTLAAGTEDTAYTITAATLLAGVTDVDGPALSITSVSVASGGGSIVNNGNGTWTYTPAANSSGPVSFSYTASDGSLSASSTASLTINPVNDAPVITAASLTVAEGGTVLITSASIGVTDPDSSSFAFTVSNVTHGAFQTTTDGVTWTNATTFTTTDLAASHVRFVHDGSVTAPTFSIQANDGAALNNLSNVFVGSVLFNNVNHAPVATPVTLAAGTEDTAYTITAATLLTGVTDVDGQALSITSVSVASGGGNIVNNGNGTWTYTPAANSSGPVSFSYTASDGSLSAGSTASLTINPVNDAPVATPVTLAAGTEDTAYTITAATLLAGVTDVDGPSLSITAVSVASGGGSIVNNGNGTWTYTPAANSSGPVSFSYTASDGSLSASSTASLTINPVNDAPVATPVTLAAGTEDTAYTITAASLLAGVTDVDGPALSITSVSVASGGGSIVNNGNGTWTYTPAANSSGPVSFSYTASDGSLSASSTASLTINPVNDAPVATPVTLAAGTEDTAYTITAASLLAGVTDVDGPALSITSVSVASGGGNIVNNGNGTWTYTPAANSTGPVSFSYTASDGSLSASSTASLTINPVNDAPVATPVTLAAGTEDTAYTITAASLLAGVTDVDGPALSITSVSVASGGGNIVNNGNGTWTYTPAANSSGPVSFSYTASDGSLSASSTASLTIKPATALAITAITTDSGTAGDFITNDTTLTVSGTNGVLGVGEKIQVSSNGGATWTDVIQNGTTWSLADAVTHPASFTYQARIIDSAGNIGTTASQPVTIDTSAPVASLAITAITTDTGTAGDFITNDTTLTVSGTNGVLDVSEKIQVSSNGGATWTDVIQNGTTWSLADAVTHPASFTYQARIIDGAGNIGTTASQPVTIDTSAPIAALAITTIAGSSSPNVTSVTVSGSNGGLANGDKVQISSDGGATWTDVVQNTAANWSFVDNVGRTADYTYRTRIVDTAGNVGVVTVPQLVRVANNGATISVGGSTALVTGTAGGTLQLSPGIAATVNVISIASGPVVITGGSSVTTAVGNAIDLSATGGTQAAPANLSVNLTGPITGAAGGVNAVQNASGSITITTSGPVVGQAGQGISVQHSATGVGNILVNGSGNVTGTGAGFSGILAQNLDTTNNGNVTVSQTGNISGGRDGIRAQTNGDGNVSVTTGSNATITGSLLYGIEAVSNGRGSISIATATGDTINSGSVGINVYNQAISIPQVSGLTTSIISVTANGTINSGTTYTGSGARPAGILAGYKGGSTNTPNSTAFGNVTVDNFANINAAGGDGIRAYNFGPGDVTVNNHGGTIVAKDMFGITASSNSTGKVSITMEAGAVIDSGSSAIQAINLAATVPVSAQSTVSVTAAGTIHSGYHLTPGGAQPQAISVGYFPGNSGVSNTNVNGTVFVDNFANVVADAGTGVNAYNFGNGSVTLVNESNTNVFGAQYGITAYSLSSGSGSVTINVGSNATITAGTLYGLAAIQGNITNSGNVSITTSVGDLINSGGIGIQSSNTATSAASSQISITTLGGLIISGFNSNGNQSGGIWAGYNPAGQGLVNPNVHGNVIVDNAANINAASGVGIGLYNFGVGNISATIRPTSTISAISAGVNAFAQGGGNVSIVNQGVILASLGAGITVGTGTGTPNSVSGVISINNSGTITSLGSFTNPAVQINNASTQAAILNNSGSITSNLFGKAASSLAVAGYNGSIAITNTGTISGNFSLAAATINNTASGIWRVSGTNFLGSAASITNSGLIAVSGQSYFNAAVLFALANSGTIDLQANSTAVVGANVTGAGNFNIGDRSMLELGGAVAAGQTISFTAGVRGVLRLDSPSNFQGSISGLANGDLIDLVGVTISSASISATTLTVTKADTTTLTYQVTSVQPNTMLNVLASDKIVVVPTTAVAITGQSTPYSSSPSSSQTYIFANDAIVAPTVATSGININASLATNPTDTIFVNINQTSSVSLPAPASGSGATPAGVNITTGGASIVLMNAGNISLAGNVNATGGSGIFTNSLTGSTDVINYGNVSGNNVGISARTSGTGLLNIVVGNSATVTGITSHGIVAISTLGAERVTTLSGATINSNAVGILAQNQGTSVAQGVLTGSNSSISISTSFGTINAGTHGISAGYLTNATTPATIPDPPNTSVYGDINIDNNATITARAGVGILAYNYGVGNIAVSNAGTITATAAGTTIPGTTQTQYGISAFNYGSGSTVVTTGPGSSITSGGAGLNVGNQAAAVAAAAASTVTVVALGSIQSGSNTNNSGSAPAGILAGFNPKNAGVFNGNVFGDVFVSAGGDITAAAGDGIQTYNYGIGNISVNVGFNVNIQALTSSTASSGNAPYGIGAFNYGPGDIHVTTSTGDVINSGSSGINASNQSTSIAANQDAMVTVSAAGSIHSRAINNNSGALPSGITAGFLGGTSSTPNLNVNGTVIVNNAANVTADAGYGISAYNFGNGDITINSGAGTTVTGTVNGIYAHAEAVGATGNIAVTLYNNVTVNSTSSYGIQASSNNNGNISVITNSGDVINSGSTGINAVNLAPSIAASYDSIIVVTAAGTINSGTALTGTGNQPGGIIAGYLGPAPGGVVTTTFPLTAVNGDVVVNNFANINAAGGDGIRAYNYGIGDIFVNDLAGTITALNVGSSTPGFGIGIAALNYGSGDIRVSTAAGTAINSASSGIAAVNKAPSTPGFVVPSTSEVSVLAFGTIHSGQIPTATAANDPPAGILAGYNPNNSNVPDSNIHGNVSIDNYATILAPAGTDGIRGVNYGTGDVTIIVESGANISAGRYGVAALGYNGGNVSIANFGLVTGPTYAVNAATTSSGKSVIDNFGHLVGNATGYNATFTNEIGGDWSLNGSSVFTGASTLLNSGLIDSNGVSTISGFLTIINTGTFEVQSGILTVGGPMTGAGNVVIYGATMEFTGESDANVQFSSAAIGTLVLDDVSHFTGTVTGFSFGDTIDLKGISPANVFVTNSGHLQVNYGAGSFELIGNYDITGFTIASDGSTGTNITWNHQAPVILTNNLTTVANPDGTLKVLGLQVTDIDQSASSGIFHFAATTEAAPGTGLTPSSDSGSLTQINSLLASGVTYQPGGSPPAVDMINLTVTDSFGASDNVHFVFNQVGSAPNSTLQGTSGKDVILATSSQDVLIGGAGQDQFLFAPTSSGPTVQHTITDFEVGIDKLDVRQFSGLTPSSLSGAIQQQGSDTLINLDAHDTLLLKNVFAANVHASDFIVHS